MRTEHGGVPDSATFAQTLSELKREGSNILLVGDAPEDVHHPVCERLMGQRDGEDPRHRLFVFTDGAAGCSTVPEELTGEGSVRIVRQGANTSHSAVDPTGESRVEGDLLSPLGKEVLATLDELQERHPELDPGMFRLCFDSVGPLLDRHRSETVFRLLHMLTTRVRQLNGMGHFHLALAHESDYVRLFEPLFDAVVEVREGEEAVEQRWHLRDSEVTSEWLTL